ncbi:MAG: hypothetical protein ACYDAG_10610 [Chloroflexota bacterium]
MPQPSRRPWSMLCLAAVSLISALLPLSLASASDSGLGGVPPVLPPVTNSDRHFGVAESFRVQQTDLAYNAGVRWSRITIAWPQLDPGYWNGPWYLPFPYLDSQIAHNIDLVGMLIGTPDSCSSDPSKGPQAVPAGLYLPYNDPNNCWGQFVRQAASFYKGRIFHWVIWNEPDIRATDPNAAYYTWSGSVADYYQLLKVAYLAIKDVDPGLTVGTAGFTYWTDKWAGRRQYFDRLLKLVAADPTAAAHNDYMDFVSLHLYNDPHSLYKVPILYHQLMAERGFDRPIWVNETNVIPWNDPVTAGTSLGKPGDMRATLDEQASFIIQAYAMGLAAGVQRIEVYKMKDGDNDVINGQALVRDVPGLQPRPDYVAYQTAAHYFSHALSATYARRGSVDQVVFARGAEKVTVLWNNSRQPATVDVKAAAGARTVKLIDKYSQPMPIVRAADGYSITLDPATNFNNPDAPDRAMIGGNPKLLVESGLPIPAVRTAPAH